MRLADYAIWQKRLTWDLLDRIKEEAGGLPILLKGVATAEDAAMAVEHGVEVVWVSNHGGRQLDHCQGTMEVIGEIMDAVDGKADVMLDGGVLRGSDVAKAIALGAKAVAIGKLEAWGLGAGGADGVRRVLEILEEELIIAMGSAGCDRDRTAWAIVRLPGGGGCASTRDERLGEQACGPDSLGRAGHGPAPIIKMALSEFNSVGGATPSQPLEGLAAGPCPADWGRDQTGSPNS